MLLRDCSLSFLKVLPRYFLTCGHLSEIWALSGLKNILMLEFKHLAIDLLKSFVSSSNLKVSLTVLIVSTMSIPYYFSATYIIFLFVIVLIIFFSSSVRLITLGTLISFSQEEGMTIANC